MSRTGARSLITPRTLKGFRDYLPAAMLERERLIDTARRIYRSYGFAPIDTPALEYEEILTGKGGAESDKQMYRFKDAGGRDVALRFDLTVPFARFAAQHIGEIGKPFKRYHIGAVWRGENTQRGRYREFVQCDFDTIGTEAVGADIETGLVIHDLLEATGAGEFTIRINDRRLLDALLVRLDLRERRVEVLRALDKLAKIGPEEVVREMVSEAGASEGRAREVLRFCMVEGANEQKLDRFDELLDAVGRDVVAALRELLAALATVASGQRFELDASIARGLDYYTGTIYETFLRDLPGIGSVCSGGRYDDLAGLYTKESLPGIGASLGVDRLLAALEELGLAAKRETPAIALLAHFEPSRLGDYLRLAAGLRRRGVAVEFYPEARKLAAQLKYADRRGFSFALILGEDEWRAATCQVKNLASGDSLSVSIADGGDDLARVLLS